MVLFASKGENFLGQLMDSPFVLNLRRMRIVPSYFFQQGTQAAEKGNKETGG